MASDLPAPLQDLVDWCKQPQPELVRDTNVLHFFLNAPANDVHPFVWQGFLYLRPGVEPPVSPIHQRGHFEGVGFLIPTQRVCAQIPIPDPSDPTFVRILIGLTVPGQVGEISLRGRRGGDDHLPDETPIRSFEAQVSPPAVVGGFLELEGWTLFTRKTTLRLA